MNSTMKNVLSKPLHMETEDRHCISPVYKEIRLNEGVESNKIYLSSPLLESEFSGYTISTEQKTTEEPSNSGGKIREKYYEFVTAAQKLNVDAHFNQLRKNLNFKMTRILSTDELISYFERIYAKVQANPRQARKNWNEEETFLLVSLVTYYCLMRDEDYNCLSEEVWDYLSSIYPGKKADKLKQRWHGIFKVTLSKLPWTPAEDQLLIKIVQEKNAQKPWRDVAIELYSRSGLGIYRQGRQCRERWVNHLDPTINRGYWTTEEDINLLKSYLELGRKWSELAKKLRNRTENTVKNRWKSLMKKFKSIVCLENLSNQPTQEPEGEEKLEQLIAQAVLNCCEKGLLTKAPNKQESSREMENLTKSPPILTRNQSTPQRSLEEGPSTKIDASDMVIVEEKNPFEQPLNMKSRKKIINPQLVESDSDNLSKNLFSGELIDRPVRPSERTINSFESKKRYTPINSTNVFRLGEGFSSVNNSYMDSNSSYTFPNTGHNNSFDYAYLAGNRLQTNTASLFQPLQSKIPTYGRSQDDFFISKKDMEEENEVEQEYGLRNPIIPRDDIHTPQKLYEGNTTPIPMLKSYTNPLEEAHPDLFVNYENENRSDSINIDTFDFFSSEIESNSEFSLFSRTNNLNDLIFNNKWDSRARAKSERDPTEQLSAEGGYGNPFKSEIVRNNNRGVRKSSLDLLLESTTIEGQETEEREMNLHLKRFSEFKQEEYFNRQSGNSMFYALVDTSKNELFLIDPVTKDNYGPAINGIKLKKPAHKPTVFEGLDLARNFPQDNMKNLKNQFSSFNLS